jgi:4-hydroxyproline epimerase
MPTRTFTCLDGHTCGNPVRLVMGGAPQLQGRDMLERRAHFLREFDWIRTGLMYEPRGHDMMSGAILYPPTRADCDVAVLFIETSGCLPMCGHGTIGTVTMALENGLIQPRSPGQLSLDTPAGKVDIAYRQEGRFVEEVRLTNVPAFLHSEGLTATVEGLGEVVVDVAYGGNFYAIVEPQKAFRDMADFTATELVGLSPRLRQALNEKYDFTHPEDARIRGLSHILWTGTPTQAGAHARNAVFYGDKAIDRSPCGTGTSARMAQLHAKGRLRAGEEFHHESIIGSIFKGRIEAETQVAGRPAVIPSVGGWARQTGINTIFIDTRDPYAHGFVVR